MLEKMKLWQALAILGTVLVVGITLRVADVPMYGVLFLKDLFL